MVDIYADSVMIERAELDEKFSAVTEAHESLRDKLTNTARKDEKNLPGEFFFKVIYLMPDIDEPDVLVQVENDDPWTHIKATARLACDE